MSNILPLTSLRAFDKVAEHLSFTLAADALHVTQSAVSQQVAQLEARVGKLLVERSGRKLRLTRHGEMLAVSCQRSFILLERALERVSRGSKHEGLELKLPPTFAMKWLMPRLPDFQVLHPQLELHLNTSVHPVDFEIEDIDIGFQRAVAADPELHAIQVMEERGILVCSPRLWGNRKAQLPELETMTFLYSSNRIDDWPVWLAQMGAPQMQPVNQLEFSFSLLMYQAAIEGLGVAIAQPELVEDDIKTGRLIAPFPQVVATGKQYFLVCQPAQRHVPGVAQFLSWIQTQTTCQ